MAANTNTGARRLQGMKGPDRSENGDKLDTRGLSKGPSHRRKVVAAQRLSSGSPGARTPNLRIKSPGEPSHYDRNASSTNASRLALGQVADPLTQTPSPVRCSRTRSPSRSRSTERTWRAKRSSNSASLNGRSADGSVQASGIILSSMQTTANLYSTTGCKAPGARALYPSGRPGPAGRMGCAGRLTVKVAPWSSPGLRAVMVPPWALTRARAMVSPIPLPVASVTLVAR